MDTYIDESRTLRNMDRVAAAFYLLGWRIHMKAARYAANDLMRSGGKMKILTESIFWKEYLPVKYIQSPSDVDHFLLNPLSLDSAGNTFVGFSISKGGKDGGSKNSDMRAKSHQSSNLEQYELVSCYEIACVNLANYPGQVQSFRPLFLCR